MAHGLLLPNHRNLNVGEWLWFIQGELYGDSREVRVFVWQEQSRHERLDAEGFGERTSVTFRDLHHVLHNRTTSPDRKLFAERSASDVASPKVGGAQLERPRVNVL
jgi:hypothetical protein